MTRSEDFLKCLVVVTGGREAAGAPVNLEQMEGTLAPMVRLALRKGAGVPALVRWVRQALNRIAGPNAQTPEAYAPQITRLLCAALLSRHCPEPNRTPALDTVAGW